MEKSESIKQIAEALVKFQNEVEAVPKSGLNPHFRSKYSTLDDIWNTVRGCMAKHGLSISQFPSGEDTLSTILMHTSGEWLMATASMHLKDATPQAQGSGITYMRRYAVSSILGLATEEDDDGNAATTSRKVQYDTSPIQDDAPVIQVGADEEESNPAIPDDEVARKKIIIGLVKKLNPKVNARIKKDIETEVSDRTQLSLTPENYVAIINSLHGQA